MKEKCFEKNKVTILSASLQLISMLLATDDGDRQDTISLARASVWTGAASQALRQRSHRGSQNHSRVQHPPRLP